MKDLASIAKEINSNASRYRMGKFQELRKNIHGLARKPTNDIFTSQTIHGEWAFHLGGRKELQYNIGFDDEDNIWFRYGVAFSLEPSQTLPDIYILRPKIHKWNEYIAKNQTTFSDLYFWYYHNT